jgi:hypothetical protein
MITKTQTPHEFLIRWDDAGKLSGAHIAFREAITDDGVEIASKFGDPLPVSMAGESGFPLADVLGMINVSALADGEAKAAQIKQITADNDAKIASITADNDAKIASITADNEANVATLTADKTLAEQALVAEQSKTAELESKLAALQPQPDINGVPQSVPRRQAKTIMELTPDASHGDLWQAALAAANAIADRTTRIITVNYLMESLVFEHAKVSELAMSLMGLTQEQVDALFVAAAKV